MEYLSKERHDEIVAELNHLISVVYPQVRDDVAETSAQGDRSENAGYREARRKQARTISRIRFLQNMTSGRSHISSLRYRHLRQTYVFLQFQSLLILLRIIKLNQTKCSRFSDAVFRQGPVLLLYLRPSCPSEQLLSEISAKSSQPRDSSHGDLLS